MESDTEDDFPLNGGSDKLAKLFEDNALDDISFRFAIPKHPSAVKQHTPVQCTVPLNVIYGKTVEAFQMKVGGYKSEGKVGIAIIGNNDYNYYQLYMYRSDERKVASVEINFQFSLLVQEHNYATFKDSLGIQWSIHFDKSSDLIVFSKEIALARWRSTPACQCKLVQEAFKGEMESFVKKNDAVNVHCTVHTLSPDNSLQENFSEKVISAPANSSNWGISLVGSCLKSRKFVIIPSQLWEPQIELPIPNEFHVMLELEIREIIPFNKSSYQSSSSLGIQNASKRSIEKKEDKSNRLSERMSRIGVHLPDLHPAETESKSDLHPVETESKSDLSDKIKLASNQTVTPVSSTSSILKEDSNFPSGANVAIASQFNILFSEVRTTNSEIRMNINRVNDKIDTLISKMDCNAGVNHKELPISEKIEYMNGVLQRLVEQNHTMTSFLEKNSLSNFESTLNEVNQLRKRNFELESLLEVAGSSSQILKEKIEELNWKLAQSEKMKGRDESNVCMHCNGAGDRVVKALEESVTTLQEKNSKLLQATEELVRQNKELSENNLLSIQERDNQERSLQLCISKKDKQIKDLERDIDRLNLELQKRCSRHAVEREVTEVAKTLMNKAYKTLKNIARDSTIIDHSFADALREMTKDYLESHFERKLPSLLEMEKPAEVPEEEPSQESSEQQGKLPSSPNKIPVPIPLPRRQVSSSKSLLMQSPEDEGPLTKPKNNPKTTEKIETDRLGDAPTSTALLPKATESLSEGDLVNSLVNTEELKNNNVDPRYRSSDNNNKDDTPVKESPLSDSNSNKTESYASPLQTPYAYSFYPPFIPNTPPPLTDDVSD